MIIRLLKSRKYAKITILLARIVVILAGEPLPDYVMCLANASMKYAAEAAEEALFCYELG